MQLDSALLPLRARVEVDERTPELVPMTTTFLDTEKRRIIAWKQATPHLTTPARSNGYYRGIYPYPFCLPRAFADENLFASIRTEALAYFSAAHIPWHGGENGSPSNHSCSSQVCCVNFLFPFIHQPNALADLLRPVYPTIEEFLPMEEAGNFVAFEWIGLDPSYLGERGGENRKRGALATSADAAVRFRHKDSTIQIVLIEWKYTERYRMTQESQEDVDLRIRRMRVYRHLFDRDDCCVDKTLLPSYESLFYEPFYQLFRQQSLAHEMELARELDADIVSTLHIAPAHNRDFLRVTSPELRALGDNSLEVWKRLVRQPDRFRSVSVEDLFGPFPVANHSGLQPWWEYTTNRYPWMLE